MSRWLVIAASQCRIDGVPNGSIDFRVRYFNLPALSDVEDALAGEPSLEYTNDVGEIVTWPLLKIFEIQGLLETKSGDEVIGFIAGVDELASLGLLDAVGNRQ